MSYTCSECKHEGTKVCASCSNYMGVPDCWEAKPRTRGERLSADMECLAKFLADLSGGDCPPDSPECEYCRLSGEPWKCWLDWLQAEGEI